MPTLALCVCVMLIAWFLVRDVRRRPKLSAAVWIPTVLVLMLGSRPLSLWLSSGGSVIYETGKARIDMGNDASASLVDQGFFFFVLAGSFLVAQSRRFRWNKLFSGNTAIILFYLYFAVSILWSGDPLGSSKRLVKDFGLLFVISVLFSESDPLQAMRATYVRCASVLFPLSIVLIKYFPNYSRIYDVDGDIQITGVTTQKNTLGEMVLICMLFLFWDFLEAWRHDSRIRWAHFPWDRVVLLALGAWLLEMSKSKTALLCLLIGVVLMVRKGLLASKGMSRAILACALSLPLLLFFSRQFASVIAPVVESMGRNMTFTGRADIWDHITLSTVNPLIGAGYWNFLGGPVGFAINQAMKTTVPNAHDGYLDIYIDGGFLGLAMLFLMLVACGLRIVNRLELKQRFANRYAFFRFAVLIVVICYNLSESQLVRMSMMWFTTLLMIVEFPRNRTRHESRPPWPPQERECRSTEPVSLRIDKQPHQPGPQEERTSRMPHEMKRRFVRVFVLAAMIHAALVFVALPLLSYRMAGSYNRDRFADGYDLLAENLAAGNGYRFYPDTAKTLMREPGYPLILAGLMLIFGKGLAAVKAINMILALLTAWLMILITRELTPEAWRRNSVVLLGPPLLFLFYPGTLVAESRGGVEITFGFLLAVFILSIYRTTRSGRFLDYLLSGVVLGLTLLVRSTPMLFPLFLLAFLLCFDGRRSSRLVICRNISAMILASLAVLSPWIIRNYSLTGKFVPTASVVGVSAQAGQYINEHLFEGRPMWLLDREASRERDKVASSLGLPFEDGPGGYYQTFYKSIDEITFSKYLMGEVISNYKRSPTLLVRCLGQNVFNFWIAGKTWQADALNAILQLPYLVFAVIGSIHCFRNKRARAVSLLLLFIGYYVSVHVAILAQARYSIPLMPFVSILSSLGIVAVQNRTTTVNDSEPVAVDALAGS